MVVPVDERREGSVCLRVPLCVAPGHTKGSVTERYNIRDRPAVLFNNNFFYQVGECNCGCEARK